MGKRKQKDEEKKETPIFGSGAEPVPEPKDGGLVKCVCTVPCVWRGYHDEGDRVFVERKLLEGDLFFKAHFKAVDGVAADAEQNAEGENGNAEAQNGNAGGENGNADAEQNAEGDGQGELGLN